MFQKRQKLLLVLLVQLSLILIVFRKFFIHPTKYLFVNAYDGLKNYFTYYSYILQDHNPKESLMKFEQMNYPYGEFIYFTDNTPFLSWPLKFIDTHVISLDTIAIPIHNYFFIFGILLSTFFIYLILKRFIKTTFLLYIFPITLAWANPQFMRFFSGTHNLSLSWLVLGMIYLLIRFYENFKQQNFDMNIRLGVYMILWIFLSAFIHLYYLIVLGLMAGFFLTFLALSEYKRPQRLLKTIFSAMVIVGVSILCVLLTLNLTDGYHELRSSFAEGYNFSGWKIKFNALFKTYGWLTIASPIARKKQYIYESWVYIGAFAMYGLLFLTLLSVWFRKKTIIWKPSFHGLFIGLLFASGLFCLFIALGEDFYPNGKDRVNNYLNVFYWGRKFSESFTQFRCVARMNWPFFWGLNFALIYLLDRLLFFQPSRFVKLISTVLVVFMLVDTFDYMSYMSNFHKTPNNSLNLETNNNLGALVKDIDFDKYQAILPIPYYHVGSEDYDYTIDPLDDKFCTSTYQLSIFGNLPLMSSKMSRTAPSQVKALSSIFLQDEPDKGLLEKLNVKPILVYYDDSQFADEIKARFERVPAKHIYANGPKIIGHYEMKLLAEKNNLKLYEWDISRFKD